MSYIHKKLFNFSTKIDLIKNYNVNIDFFGTQKYV